MPERKGYKGTHIDDRTKKPGTVKAGKLTMDAYGPYKPLGTMTMDQPRKTRKGD